jgi:hypothetical protein
MESTPPAARAVHVGDCVVRGRGQKVACAADPAHPDIEACVDQLLREVPERRMKPGRMSQPCALENDDHLEQHAPALFARQPLELWADARSHRHVMQPVRGHVGARERLEVAHELRMPVEAHRSFGQHRRKRQELGQNGHIGEQPSRRIRRDLPPIRGREERDLQFRATLGPNIVVAVGEYGSVLRTTDGGATWTPQSSGTSHALEAVTFVDANTGTAVGHGGTILHTITGGE